MARYIDADELIKVLRAGMIEENDWSYESPAECRGVLEWAIAEAERMPTADVAEVVRCKDCRYVFKEDEYSYWCNGFTSPMRLVTPKTFCSHGRRRND